MNLFSFGVLMTVSVLFQAVAGDIDPASLKAFPDNSDTVLKGDATWGQISVATISGYPNSSNVYLRGDGNWSALPLSGLVSGPSTSTSNSVALFSDATGTVIKNCSLTVSTSGIVSGAADPVSAQDLATKNYVDTLVIQPSQLSGYPSDATQVIRGDGSWGGVPRASVPTGTMQMFAGPAANIPTGFLLCDGSAYPSRSYSSLYTAIGTAWGNTDDTTTKTITTIASSPLTGTSYQAKVTTATAHALSVGDTVTILGSSLGAYNAATAITITSVPTTTTFTYTLTANALPSAATGGYYQYKTFAASAPGFVFKVPDTRGYFVRGLDTRTSGQKDPGTRTGPGLSGTSSGAVVGSYQTGDVLSHTHTMVNAGSHTHYDSGHAHSFSVNAKLGYQGGSSSGYVGTGHDTEAAWTYNGNTNNGQANLQANGDHGHTINAYAGQETRPINFAVNYIIKT